MGPSQQLLRRRSGSFPNTAQEEEWELLKYCPGGGVGAKSSSKGLAKGVAAKPSTSLTQRVLPPDPRAFGRILKENPAAPSLTGKKPVARFMLPTFLERRLILIMVCNRCRRYRYRCQIETDNNVYRAIVLTTPQLHPTVRLRNL